MGWQSQDKYIKSDEERYFGVRRSGLSTHDVITVGLVGHIPSNESCVVVKEIKAFGNPLKYSILCKAEGGHGLWFKVYGQEIAV